MDRLTRRRAPAGTGSSSRIIGGGIALFGLLIIVFSAAAPWYTLDVEITDRSGDWRNTHYAVDGFGDVTVSAPRVVSTAPNFGIRSASRNGRSAEARAPAR